MLVNFVSQPLNGILRVLRTEDSRTRNNDVCSILAHYFDGLLGYATVHFDIKTWKLLSQALHLRHNILVE